MIMKSIISLLISIGIGSISFGQSLEAPTLSYGGTVVQVDNLVGSTLGEIIISTDQLSNASFYHGFQLLVEFEISNYPMCLNVVTTSAFGSGSLREAVSCAFANDIITLDQSLNNQQVLLSIPSIEINKPLTFLGIGANISLENEFASNTSSLLDISDELIIENLSIIGKSDNSMIIELLSSGTIEIIEGALEKVTIN